MSHKQLSLSDRINIKIMLEGNKKITEIAKELGRSKSTISEEITNRILKYNFFVYLLIFPPKQLFLIIFPIISPQIYIL